MRKGFGLYSTHETTIFFLKMMLVSFWVGVDLIAALVVSTFPVSVLARHGVLVIAGMGILIAGTVFAILLAWATGSLFGRQAAAEAETETGAVGLALQRLKRQPYHLLAAGAAVVLFFLIIGAGYFISLQRESELMAQSGRADLAIARKCAEVASLEKQLFQSDEQLVLTQCLIQYDKTYAMRGAEPQ